MKRHGLHVTIAAIFVGFFSKPSADRSHDGRARADNNSARSNNDSAWGDNDRVCGDAARPVYSGRADDGACFRCCQGKAA